MPSLSLRSITRRYSQGGGVHAITGDLESEDRLVLLGPSGSGKTTLLRLIAGLETPDSGTIAIDGRDVTNVPPHRRGIVYVPQKPALYPEMTVSELVGPHPEAIERFHLSGLTDRRPHQLSGGEKQRVGLAKALSSGAKLWLLDEPFAALDPPFRAEFRSVLLLIAASARATIILVTHDPVDAWALGRRVGVLGDGRLQCLGTPEELRLRPGNRFVAFCLGSFCLVDGFATMVSDGRPGEPGRGESGGVIFTTPDGSVTGPLPHVLRSWPPSTTRLTLGLRPDDVRLGLPDDPRDAVRLMGWAPESAAPADSTGGRWILTLARGPHRVRVAWPSALPPPVGVTADWHASANQCVWFDERGDRIEI